MDIHYNAFISYRHHPADIKVAEQIHRGLEHYRIPKALKQKTSGKMRLFRSMNGNARLVEIGNDRRDNICETADFVIEKTYAIQHAIQQNVARIEICAF